MTLPFRRRHNDAEASHDRARAITAMAFTEPAEPADAVWLEAHLTGCVECRTEAEAYAADHELLLEARAQAPEPPRDLWARTAAAIERESGRREVPSSAAASGSTPGTGGRSLGLRDRRVPLGAISGLIVVVVVVGASLWPKGLNPLVTDPQGSDVVAGSPPVYATPIAVDAGSLAWVQVAPDGSYHYVQANVSEVCPPSAGGCAPLSSSSTTRLNLSDAPAAMLLSPNRDQLVVVTQDAAGAGGDIVVVNVPAMPTVDPGPSVEPSVEPPTLEPGSTPEPTVEPTPTTTSDPDGSPGPSATAEPSEGHAIVSGVIVVGEVAYSTDGRWFAFAARPADGGTGPDLYVWRVGDPLAVAITSDHRTFFAGWVGNQILASRVAEAAASPDDALLEQAPEPTGEPTPTPTRKANPKATAKPDPKLTPTPIATPTEEPSPQSSPDPGPAAVEEHPSSFLLDPETGASTPLRGIDVWDPTVDPTGRFVVYWSGTLVPDETSTVWRLGTGRLVIDRWLDGTQVASPDPASPEPTAAASDEPIALDVGPAGEPVTITEGATPDFEAWFDPSGTRLAIWAADASDPAVGTLRLIVLDPDTGALDPTVDPLPGVAALRGVSIDDGRLAWVTPPGQDGEGSHVQILAWHGDNFGQVRTLGSGRLHVVR